MSMQVAMEAVADGAAGLRERRRLSTHLRDCERLPAQPPWRWASIRSRWRARQQAAPAARGRALLPLPAFLRRRLEDGAGLLELDGPSAAEQGASLAGRQPPWWSLRPLAAGGAGVATKASGGGVPLPGRWAGVPAPSPSRRVDDDGTRVEAAMAPAAGASGQGRRGRGRLRGRGGPATPVRAPGRLPRPGGDGARGGAGGVEGGTRGAAQDRWAARRRHRRQVGLWSRLRATRRRHRGQHVDDRVTGLVDDTVRCHRRRRRSFESRASVPGTVGPCRHRRRLAAAPARAEVNARGVQTAFPRPATGVTVPPTPLQSPGTESACRNRSRAAPDAAIDTLRLRWRGKTRHLPRVPYGHEPLLDGGVLLGPASRSWWTR